MDDDGSSHGDQDAASRRAALITFATKQLRAGQACLPELEALLAALTPKTKSIHATGLVSFVQDLKTDVRGIEARLAELEQQQKQQINITDDDHDESKARADVEALWRRLEPRTTGAYHAATRWRVLRRCAHLVAVKRTFQGSERDERREAVRARCGGAGGSGGTPMAAHETQHLHRVLNQQARAEVAVVNGGASWVDVRWITADRLARQMADAGWSWGDYGPGDVVDASEWEDAPFARQVHRVVAAARRNRHEYSIPTVRLVLPNLARGAHPDVDVLLEQLPRIDSGVTLIIEDATSEAFADDDIEDEGEEAMAARITTLVGDDRQRLTDTLNLEHTVLVDLISDLTHLRLVPQPWQSRTTRAQIEEENASSDGVMAPTLYPLLRGRRLVCTREAASHFHEMLTTVGTARERARGRLLVPLYDEERAESAETLRARFNELSERPLPEDVQFPVDILWKDEHWDEELVRRLVEEGEEGQERLPAVALDIVRRGLLRSSKLSTYMYGWRCGVVTLTSNKEIRAHMRTWVEGGRRGDEERGPRLYCVEVTRNLLAKSAAPPPGWEDGEGTTEGEKDEAVRA